EGDGDLYERREFPASAMRRRVEESIKSGAPWARRSGSRFADEHGLDNMQKQLQSKKFDQEARKLWLRMRNEVVQELLEKGSDVE
ncbi:hypothetical protein ZWY2020_006701, partial [Hordeum vulgare]